MRPARRSTMPERREAAPSMWDFNEEQSATFLDKRQSCSPYINLFARGTTESGTMGSTVGPKLSSALSKAGGSKFTTVGIPYTADLAGINCIGLPGGIKCVDQLAKLAAKCPQSQFFLSGYSQGAMVARICAAFSKDDVKKRIKVWRISDLAIANSTANRILGNCDFWGSIQRSNCKRTSTERYQSVLQSN
jgi:hypothetical protein